MWIFYGWVSKIKIVDCELFVELPRFVGFPRKEAKHDCVAVAHQIAADRVTAGVEMLQIGREQ